MSWITPDLIEILLSILKAVVILLVVVTCGAFMRLDPEILGSRHLYPGTDDRLHLAAAGFRHRASESELGGC